MKFILQLLIFGMATLAFADEADYFSITTNQAIDVKQKLESFEKNKYNLPESNDETTKEQYRQFIGFYLLHTNDISVKSKWVISRCYLAFGLLPEAAKLSGEYVKIYTNDYTAWETLGESYDRMNLTNEALNAFRKAVELGDKDSYEPLAGIAFKSDRLDIIRDITPQLMALKNDKDTSENNKINLTTILLAYSLKADRKDVFIETLKGADMKKLLQNDTVKLNITSGCGYFEDEDTNGDIKKIRQEIESFSPSNSTNSVSRPPR